MLVLSQQDYDEIRTHGELTYPNECCGVLLGHVAGGHHLVSEVVRCSNTKGQAARTRYKISPKDLIGVQRDARERGLSVVGFYHSHPDAPPHFSGTDLEEAYWIGCSYVIASVFKGAAGEVKSYQLMGVDDDRRLEDEGIRVLPKEKRGGGNVH
jgi:proteasome lid subunit RPN8/RPN11